MARPCSTICLPAGKDDYEAAVADPGLFRAWLDRSFRAWPELFPEAFRGGYRLKDGRTSAKTGAVTSQSVRATVLSSRRKSLLFNGLIGLVD